MATYADLFGDPNAPQKPKGDRRWIKFDEVGETFLLQQTGDPEQVPQKVDGKVKYIVQAYEKAPWKPMGEGTFDPEKVAGSFIPPEKDVEIPVRVVGKKDSKGVKVEDFEPFETTWELKNGDTLDKFKEELLDTGAEIGEGTLWAYKQLAKVKPKYKYSVKIVKTA
jgi:hypothetical protein